MYRQSSSRGSFDRRGHSNAPRFGQQGNRFSGGNQRRQPKKLDARMFINQAPVEAVEASPAYVSEYSFSDFAVADSLKAAIAAKGYTTPTPIQDQAIPVVLQGRDVIGIANTGTGKTAAFLIPLINKVLQNREEKILIVAPTRELALQINAELRGFTQGMRIFSVPLIGGASSYQQRNDLRRGFNFVIGTPGRLKDLIQANALDLSIFKNIVLDEVDRMVDIGFIRDVEYLISLLPSDRQSLFFSATVTDKVNQILRKFVTDPVKISVKTQETAHTVEQDVIEVRDHSQKVDLLHNVLIQEDVEKVIVFARTKRGVEKLSRTLQVRGFKTASIHGNKTQGQRQRALDAFKKDYVRILLATDVASRGIDVQDVTHVINYDAPESYDDYVHRIGRTGRANKRGKAITFVE